MTNPVADRLAVPHWWGFAALPEGVAYPENGEYNPLTLVCQFPHADGLVSVFADLDYFMGDLDAESGGIGSWPQAFYKVIYSPSREGLHLHEIRYDDGFPAVPEALPLEMPDLQGSKTTADLQGAPSPAVDMGASHIWGEAVCFTDEIAQDWPGYKVLVQLEESDQLGLRFYDCGSLFFLIPEEDIAQCRFDRVVCALYSY